MLGISSTLKKRSTTDSQYRRDVRFRSVNSIRGFSPHEAVKFLMANPHQPTTPADALWDQTVSSSGDNQSSVEEAASYIPPDLRSQYLCSIAPLSARSRSRMRSCMDDAAAASMSSSSHPTPDYAPLPLITQPPSDTACVFGTSPLPVTPLVAIENCNSAYIMLLHQEALYRQLLFPEVDCWFTSLVETAWDERDRLLLSSEEEVQRYWVSSDESKARETLAVFKRDAEVGHARVISKKRIAMEELVERSQILQAYHRSCHCIESEMLEAFHVSQLSALERTRRESEVEKRKGTDDGMESDRLPDICRHPSPPPAQGSSRSQSESAKRKDPRAAPRMDEELHAFMLGTPNVLQFVPDSEMLTRTHVVSAEERMRHYLVALLEHYISTTATLRRPCAMRALTLEEAELAERRVLHGQVFEMLRDACSVLAVLRKRDLERTLEPVARWELISMEREDWLHARRAECARKLSESQVDEELLKQHRMELLRIEQELGRQRMLFERAECDARFDVARREARMFQLLIDEVLEDRAVAMGFQLRYEMRMQTVMWTPETYEAVFLNEISTRGRLLKEEECDRETLRSREVSSYLHSHRNMMINRDVAAALRACDNL